MTLPPWARTRAALAAVACLAVAVVLTIVSTHDGRAAAEKPSPRRHLTASTTLPTGAPLATYVDPDRLVLSIHGVAVPGRWGGATSTGDLTVAVTNSLHTVGLFVRGHRVGTLRHVRSGDVLASPDGRSIGWIEVRGRSVHLVAASVTGAGVRELGRLALDPAVVATDSEGSESVLAVAVDHTVTYGGVTSGHTWRPGHDPEDADLSASLTRPAGFPNSVDPPELNPDGTWGAWPTNDQGRSPVDTETPWTAVTVQQPHRRDTRQTFVMPDGGAVQWLFWETDTDVIVAVSGDEPAAGSEVTADGYVRCNVLDHHCEYASVPGDR